MADKRLTREQVLAWNRSWTKQDRAVIDTALDKIIPDGEPAEDYCYVPPSEAYIGVWVHGPQNNSSGNWHRMGDYRALIIFRTRLKWHAEGDYVPKGLDTLEVATFDDYFQWLPLSTYTGRGYLDGGERPPPPSPSPETCSHCHLTLPATGTCDCTA